MDKKGFEIQFNWLFVLVAGAAILLFFGVIIAKQKTVSDTSTKTTVLKSIESIISSAGATTDTTKKENLPETQIGISCNRVSIGGVSKNYQNLILFAPDSIKGTKLIWQTLGFNSPYKITNFLYMDDGFTRYILVGDSNLAKDVNKSLSSQLKKQLYKAAEVGDIKNENDQKVVFMLFDYTGDANAQAMAFKNMPDSDAFKIAVDEIGNGYGKIDFYKKSGNVWGSKIGTSYFLGKASLVGALYSHSPVTYSCNMQNAFKRMNSVSKVYIQKTISLSSSLNADCRKIYSDNMAAAGPLKSISDNSQSAASGFSQDNVKFIAGSAKSLSDGNRQLQRLSCSTIY